MLLEKSLRDFLIGDGGLQIENEGMRIVALSAGTAALHLGLILLGVQPGDEVICQSFTFAASANPIAYLEATPVFVDSEKETWNMDPVIVGGGDQRAVGKDGKVTEGDYSGTFVRMPGKMDEVMEVANCYGIPV